MQDVRAWLMYIFDLVCIDNFLLFLTEARSHRGQVVGFLCGFVSL